MTRKEQWTRRDDYRVLAKMGTAYLSLFVMGIAGAFALYCILGPSAAYAATPSLYSVTVTSDYTKCVDVMPERKAEHSANRAIRANDGSYRVSLDVASQLDIRRSGTCKGTNPTATQSPRIQATKAAVEQANQPVEVDKGSALEAALLDDGWIAQTYDNSIQEDVYPPSIQAQVDAFNHQPDSVRATQSNYAFQLAQASGGTVAEDFSIVPASFYSQTDFTQPLQAQQATFGT